MKKKYDFVKRDDLVATSVKFRTIRKHKNYIKRQRFWESRGWHYSHHTLIHFFPRWIKRIKGELIWVACVEETHTHCVWRFERAARYKWWSNIAPDGYHYDEWMEQAKLQGGYKSAKKSRN